MVFAHFFNSKVGCPRVTAIVKDIVETRNDINGVVYVALDLLDSWKE